MIEAPGDGVRLLVHSGVDRGFAAPRASAELADQTFTLQGTTTHFVVYYAESLGATGAILADAVLATCEADYAALSGWFGGTVPGGLPFQVYLRPGSIGAGHAGCAATDLFCDTFTNADPDLERALVVNQASEVFMAYQGIGWDCSASNGEALSRILMAEVYPGELTPPGIGETFATASAWLSSGRPNFVDSAEPTDTTEVSIGCATLFINFLRYQLGFSLNEIVQAGGGTLADTYRSLTGNANGFAVFSRLVGVRFPQSQHVLLPGDNAFPTYLWDQWTARVGAPPAVGDPATLLAGDEQHIFYRDAKGVIDHIWSSGQTQQLSHDQWTASEGAPLAAGDPATLVTDDEQHIFYRDADGNISHIWWSAETQQLTHDQWTAFVGAPPAAGDPATMLAGDEQHVFYRGVDGAIEHIWWSGQTQQLNHDQWTALAGAPPAAGDPATLLSDNEQHIFYRGVDGAIDHIWWSGQTQQLSHDEWTALAGAPPAAGDPATLLVGDEQHVFYRDADGVIDHIWWSSQAQQLSHDQWTALVGAPPAAGNPATLLVGDEQHVFYRDFAGYINHIRWSSRASRLFHAQWAVGGVTPAALGEPLPMAPANEQHAFYRDAAGAVNHIWW